MLGIPRTTLVYKVKAWKHCALNIAGIKKWQRSRNAAIKPPAPSCRMHR